MKLLRLALVALATLRVTRFFTSDILGEWLVVGRAKLWAWRSEGVSRETDDAGAAWQAAEPVPSPPAALGWRSKLVSGLDCPFCVGFWAGVALLLGEAVLGRWRVTRGAWTLFLGALGLNYVVGHVSARLDG